MVEGANKGSFGEAEDYVMGFGIGGVHGPVSELGDSHAISSGEV